MDQHQRFGRFFLFREDEANSYRTVHRAGLAQGRAIERIVRLEVFDQPGIEAGRLLEHLEASKGLQDRLRDPHIAPGVGVGQVDGTPYTAYEFELGTTLSTFMSAAREQSFPVPFDQALFVGERIALALAAAYRHEHNQRPTLHSFLTPDSVLLSNEGEVKVSGFEVGYALREQLAGSPGCAPYLSPKSRAGRPPADHDDVFSLGSILFELVTGEPLSIESVDLDHSVVQATGEPFPESLRLLLAGSFAPPEERIPDVVAWQQNLGRVILDGEYNPTTFNLAFLIHTLLREPLARGAEQLAREKRFLLPPQPEDEQTQETTAVAPTVGSSAETRADRSFWLGFSISGMTACAILVLVLTLGGGSDPAPASDLAARAAVAAEPAPDDDMAASPASPVSPVSPTAAGETPAGPSPGQPASLVLTEVVNGELGEPVVGEEHGDTDERGTEIERLKAEYEQELDRLRKQIEENQPSDPPAIERSAASEPAELSETSELSEPGEPAEPSVPSLTAEPTETLTDRRAQSASAVATQSEPLPDRAPPEAPVEPELALVESLEAATAEPAQPDVSAPAPGEAVVQTDRSSIPAEVELFTQQEATPGEPVVSSVPSAAAPTRAQLLRLTPPAYPVAARRLGLSATARVKVLISSRGRVKQAEIVGPRLGSGFDAAALTAARRSRWQPATRGGEPIESWHAVTIEFQP